jgi:hypothetical protein
MRLSVRLKITIHRNTTVSPLWPRTIGPGYNSICEGIRTVVQSEFDSAYPQWEAPPEAGARIVWESR